MGLRHLRFKHYSMDDLRDKELVTLSFFGRSMSKGLVDMTPIKVTKITEKSVFTEYQRLSADKFGKLDHTLMRVPKEDAAKALEAYRVQWHRQIDMDIESRENDRVIAHKIQLETGN